MNGCAAAKVAIAGPSMAGVANPGPAAGKPLRGGGGAEEVSISVRNVAFCDIRSDAWHRLVTIDACPRKRQIIMEDADDPDQ
jgi:hypothetical protein